MKNTHEGVLILTLLHGCFLCFLNCTKWYQIAQRTTYYQQFPYFHCLMFVNIRTNVRIWVYVFIRNSRVRYFLVLLSINKKIRVEALHRWFVKYYIFVNKLLYNSFYVCISGHIFRYIPIYCINIRALTLMLLTLSIPETIIGVNEASSSYKGFSLFLLRVLSGIIKRDN